MSHGEDGEHGEHGGQPGRQHGGGRGQHRRVVVPATNASPEGEPDFTEPHLELDEIGDGLGERIQEIGSEQWWRAQLPPHWG